VRSPLHGPHLSFSLVTQSVVVCVPTQERGNEMDVSKLANRPIRLRFGMKDADLYAIRFHV